MKNTFIDSQESVDVAALDFITVRNSDGRLVFMGERKNVKCFDRLKKVSERVFETIQGQEYKFLDKMPEPAAEIEISPEMRKRAEEAWRLHCMLEEAGERSRAAAIQPQPEKPLTFEEQLEQDWQYSSSIRKEFTNQASYAAYMRAVRDGRCRIYGVKM